jgi:hypothetical protein
MLKKCFVALVAKHFLYSKNTKMIEMRCLPNFTHWLHFSVVYLHIQSLI